MCHFFNTLITKIRNALDTHCCNLLPPRWLFSIYKSLPQARFQGRIPAKHNKNLCTKITLVFNIVIQGDFFLSAVNLVSVVLYQVVYQQCMVLNYQGTARKTGLLEDYGKWQGSNMEMLRDKNTNRCTSPSTLLLLKNKVES